MMDTLHTYHDVAAERSVIAHIIDGYRGSEIIDKCRDGLFYEPACIRAWREILRVWELSGTVSLADVAAVEEDVIGWLDHKLNAEASLKRLEYCAKVRRAGMSCLAIENAVAASEEIDGPIDSFLSIEDSADVEEYDMQQLSVRAADRWGEAGNSRVFKTDISTLDKYCMMRPGQLVYIVAPPKTGKSWLLTSLCVQLCHRAASPYIISAEMHPDDIYTRMVSYICGIDAMAFEDPDCQTKRSLLKWSEKAGEIAVMKIKACWAVGITMLGLRSKILRAKRLGCDVVAIDYLQRVVNDNAKDMRMAVSQVSGMLADLAKKTGLLILCASQAGRAAHTVTGGKKLTEAHHARESSAIEADADIILSLTDCTEYGDLQGDDLDIKIKITQRNGRGGVVSTTWNPITGRYKDAH